MLKVFFMIWNMARNDFKLRYASSYFGIFWAFAQPIATIALFWFVFQVGLRAQNMGNVPYIAWFVVGIVPWFFFADALMSSAGSVVEYNYLVKKVMFPVWVLPLVKLFSALFIHIFFIMIALIVCVASGISLHLSLLLLPFYTLLLSLFTISVGRLCAAILPFFRDLAHVLSIVLQFGMWLTPIMWDVHLLPESLQKLLKLNPIYFCVQGYRKVILWHDTSIDWVWLTHFCIITLFFSLISWYVFRKLSSHFIDVL